MSSDKCQKHPEPQQTITATPDLSNAHNQYFIPLIRSAVKESIGEDLQDEAIAQVIAANMGNIMKLAKQGQFTQMEIDQLKQFIASNKAEPADVAVGDATEAERTDAKNLSQAVVERKEVNAVREPDTERFEQWLELLEKLLEACQTLSRIEQFLRSRTGPEFAHARALFPMLKKLPKVPRPQWRTPSTMLWLPERQFREPSFFYMQIRHSLIWTSTGIMLYPNDIAHILLRDIKRFDDLMARGRLTQAQELQLKRILASFKKEWEAERPDQTDAESLKRAEIKRSRESTHIPQPEPEPLMGVLEAYHAVSRLADFYRHHTGPEFSEAQVLLQTLRRELQREVTNTLRQTDFNKYLS